MSSWTLCPPPQVTHWLWLRLTPSRHVSPLSLPSLWRSVLGRLPLRQFGPRILCHNHRSGRSLLTPGGAHNRVHYLKTLMHHGLLRPPPHSSATPHPPIARGDSWTGCQRRRQESSPPLGPFGCDPGHVHLLPLCAGVGGWPALRPIPRAGVLPQDPKGK